MKLSKNFSLSEMCRSQTATRRGIDNTPDDAAVGSLQVLCLNVLQPIRDHFRASVNISSGYRSPKLNRRIGGSRTSQHCFGEAADFTVAGYSVTQVFRYIATSDLPFDQLIWEFGRWVHVSCGPRERRQILLARKVGRKTVYSQLTPEEAARWKP